MRRTKHNIIITFICLSACTSNEEMKSTYHYDEPSLKAFVLSTRTFGDSAVLKELDLIVVAASGDSAGLHQTIAYLAVPFSNPNSSFRSQALYEKLLETELKSPYYTNDEKQAAREKLRLLQQNNVGSQANDFVYITPADYKKRMHDINSRFTLLYFNNPDCNACKEMKVALKASAVIDSMVKEGELKILSMYTDRDEKLWLDSLKSYPAKWIAGRDENEYLYKNKVYDLRAIPTIYLLDSQKKVLLKDAVSVKQIQEVLQNE